MPRAAGNIIFLYEKPELLRGFVVLPGNEVAEDLELNEAIEDYRSAAGENRPMPH
jgi:hypothetical protein